MLESADGGEEVSSFAPAVFGAVAVGRVLKAVVQQLGGSCGFSVVAPMREEA